MELSIDDDRTVASQSVETQTEVSDIERALRLLPKSRAALRYCGASSVGVQTCSDELGACQLCGSSAVSRAALLRATSEVLSKLLGDDEQQVVGAAAEEGNVLHATPQLPDSDDPRVRDAPRSSSASQRKGRGGESCTDVPAALAAPPRESSQALMLMKIARARGFHSSTPTST